ncbi:pilus assembly protein TadG-related protein [Gilvimarinus sp. SDUM040013]|uniref:Pilus assembly protein TadG-related protein n=1 Tax=Gilvimarinus gilvus TaxID=3058038 RepID=A0ABU4S316_9GAMM|nr:pilus assembly protein TadG-related protein [Gilvimarinus sp. SDUM040013]MDO3385341.1 pilus assembly protein TadG-related protein [Gilvimarinus sp. SDUM040013]MDX6851482.1 pilus assembly protein TadG-related protein [Gilvimarinus sp. SDUM040013]
MNSIRSDKGQAFIFGLLFLAVVVMALLILYNQGQLVTNRMQLENAADASVYTQAKLSARNQNFIAYTNRAMVANEVSIGQMLSLLSWAKRYQNTQSFLNYPVYKIPIAPPSPTTFQQALQAVTVLHSTVGNVVTPMAKAIVSPWTTVVSYFNATMGVFQKMFAVSTLAAQVEMAMGVVEDHEDDPSNEQMYIPAVGWFFFTQNALLTYFGDAFDPGNLVSALGESDSVSSFTADDADLVNDWLGGQGLRPETMIANNSPANSGSSSSGGANSNLDSTAETEDNAVEAYKRYVAIVNENRTDFTRDRHWELGIGVDVPIPRLELSLGIVTLTIDLDISVWGGFKGDGGTAFMSNSALEDNSSLEKIGWSAIDVYGFGIDFQFALYVEIELCLPIVGCNSWTLLDLDIAIELGFPLGGATHQIVAKATDAKKIITDWESSLIAPDTPKWGGDPEDDVNDGAFSLFHAQALAYGSITPLPSGMYGTNTANDVTTNYPGPPSFFSLGGSFQESGRSYEFTTALAKSLDDVVTTDHDNIGINSNDNDWDNGDIQYTNFDVKTRSRAEGDDYAANYQQFIWNDDRPMMTISSAETYFNNPMQADGNEPASLFSPFWDARLREPSAIAILIATGEIDFEEIFEGLGSSAVDMVDWLLHAIAERLVDTGVDYLLADVPAPMDDIIDDPIRDAAQDLTSDAVDSVVDELEDFLP